MDGETMNYSDIIKPDDSVKNLIEQLEGLNKSYGEMVSAIKAGAKSIIDQMKSMSTATSEGRAEIDDATAAANRLERAQKELKFALSDTGKEVAWLKAQTASQNKMSAEQQKASAALIGSYDKLKSELREQISLWKSLSDTERAGSFGQDLLNSILSTKQQLTNLDGQLKVHVETLSAVEKAEQKLAFLRSEEGKRLIQLKQQIADEIAANKTQKASIDEVAQAQQKLDAARAATRVQANELNILAKEANRIAKLQAQLNLSTSGSYNQLAAQYELNKIRLNSMSQAEREAADVGKKLEAETLAIYQRMIELQEATGNHRLSVGHYEKAWNGLSVAVSQVIRELPAAAVSLNTFFLGISNNVPILIDEINKLREANKKAIAQGKPTQSIIKGIAAALFSWNTALVIGLTVFSSHGKQIINWVTKLVKGKAEALKFREAVENVNKALEKTNASYGQNVVTVQKLAREWKNLSSKKEQLQWIKDNKTEFDKLGISIKSVNDAENALVEHTDDVIRSLQLRAKAAAAMKLAADEYEKALQKELEAEQAEYEFSREVDPETGKVTIKKTKKEFPKSEQGGARWATPGAMSISDEQDQRIWESAIKRRVALIKSEQEAAETNADAYFQMSEAFNQAADSILKEANIEKKHAKESKKRHPRGRDPRDLTDQIWRNDLQIRKKYELSISALQRDEFQKRKIEAIDATNATIREMQEKFRKNQVFIDNPDGKYKALTPDQRKQIDEQQKEIAAIIENAQRKLQIDLKDIEYEQQIDSLKKLRQVVDWRLDIVSDEVEKEKQLRIEQLEELESLYSTNAKTSEGGEMVVTGSLTPEQIADFQRRREQIIAEYDLIIYNMRKADIDAQVELVKRGTEEELKLLLQQNEIARQIALAENRAKPVEQRQSETQINAQYDKRGALIGGGIKLSNFDEAQAAAEAEFNAVKHNETQITIFKLNAERDRWREQIKLAKEGALDWSDAQIKEAEAMIKKLDREIEEAGSFINLVGEKGVGGALLTRLGLDDDQIAALSEAVNIVLENIKAIADAEVEAAEKAVEAAEKRVEAFQKAYDAEIEARNNGYANNVATAKKELQQEQRNQAKKQRLLEEAQRRQQAIDTLVQASSLVTASANLWSSFSSIPIVGPALAIAAIAAMWGSFALAKVRAAQITKQASQEYGEGGLEFLEGGSHASGNDIDLQTRNSKGKNMRAEGGEAMAIINRRNTRKYRKVLPQLVNSLNNGTFEDKFVGAFKTGDSLAQQITYQTSNVDLSRLEEDVRALKQNTERRYYTMPNGSIIEVRKNVTRIIK